MTYVIKRIKHVNNYITFLVTHWFSLSNYQQYRRAKELSEIRIAVRKLITFRFYNMTEPCIPSSLVVPARHRMTPSSVCTLTIMKTSKM